MTNKFRIFYIVNIMVYLTSFALLFTIALVWHSLWGLTLFPVVFISGVLLLDMNIEIVEHRHSQRLDS